MHNPIALSGALPAQVEAAPAPAGPSPLFA